MYIGFDDMDLSGDNEGNGGSGGSPGSQLVGYLNHLPADSVKNIPATRKYLVDPFLVKAQELDPNLGWSRESMLYVEWDRLVAKVRRWCESTQAQDSLPVSDLRRIVEIADEVGWRILKS